jgi:hypothetical protein
VRRCLVLLALAGCGDNLEPGTFVDAAPTGPINVLVTFEDLVTPAANVAVVYGDTSGEVVDVQMTDASGQSSTLAFVSLEPEAHSPAQIGAVTIFAADLNCRSYEPVLSGPKAGNVPIAYSVPIYDDCVRPGGGVDIVNTNCPPGTYGLALDVHSGGAAPTECNRSDLSELTIDTDNLPSLLDNVSCALAVEGAGYVYSPPVDSVTCHQIFHYIPDIAKGLIFGVHAVDAESRRSSSWSRTTHDLTVTSDTIDLATGLLPAVGVASVDLGTGFIGVERPRIGWLAPAMPAADYALAMTADFNTSTVWSVMASADTTEVRIPALPDSLAEFRITGGFTFVTFDDASYIDGFRQSLAPPLPPDDFSVRHSSYLIGTRSKFAAAALYPPGSHIP